MHYLYSAVIFDLDGTLTNTQSLHSHIESSVLMAHGVRVNPNRITERFAGMPDLHCFETLLAEHGYTKQDAKHSAHLCVEEKWGRLALEKYYRDLQLMPGALELILRLAQANVPLGVGSASRQRYCEHVLTSVDIRRFFVSVVGGDMVARGKPEPDIFLRVASELSVDPRACLVIGDSVHDQEAAMRAGMGSILLDPALSAITCTSPRTLTAPGMRHLTPDVLGA